MFWEPEKPEEPLEGPGVTNEFPVKPCSASKLASVVVKTSYSSSSKKPVVTGMSMPLVEGWWTTGFTLLLCCVTLPPPEEIPGEKPGILRGGDDTASMSCGGDAVCGVTGWKLG